MNAVGLLLVWVAVQVSVFCLAGIAIYLVARRRNPAAGAWAAGAALVMAVGVTAIALSPWPRWWSVDASLSAAAATDESAEQTADKTPKVQFEPGMISGPLERDAAKDSPHAAPRATRRGWQAVVGGLRDEVSRTSGVSTWRWPAWLAVLVAGGCALAVARLVVAVIVAHRYRATANTADDAALVELLAQVCRQAHCRRPIELRVSTATGSAATMGWRRPAIILPADWRSWTADELRAVLAHEVAHVARGDFMLALLAQLGVALHFYNPLVHWLARRLRLEQEMAADVWGAQLLGSRQTYLTALAQMALRTSDPPIAWAMRPFLPTRGTLMRRVEMLHREKVLPRITISNGRRFALAAVVLAAGCAIAGLRGPQGGTAAAAAPPDNSGDKSHDKPAAAFNLDFVPNEAAMVLALRPAELIDVKALAPVKNVLAAMNLFKPLRLPLNEIEEFKFSFAGSITSPDQIWPVLVLRSKKPYDRSKYGASWTTQSEKVVGDGQEYYRAVQAAQVRGGLQAYWFPDERTIVVSTVERITETFSLRGDVSQPAWTSEWKKIASNPAALMLSAEAFQSFVPGGAAGVNLAEDADKAFFAGTETSDGFEVRGTMACRSNEAAAQIAASLPINLGGFAKELIKQPGIGALFATLIHSTRIEADGATVRSVTRIGTDTTNELAKTMQAAQGAARRAVMVSNMKQIMIALHNYHDLYRRLPPAVVIGPDGKTPHSWRVELLPYLETVNGDALYKQYKMDEPWDSENNLEVMKAAAGFFSAPGQEDGNCAYFMLVGPGTAFDPADPKPNFRSVTDGLSKTIAIVEAKRPIPWTKPEDIEYDPDKPLAELGGFHQGGFNVGMLDGSVHFLPEKIDEGVLRALISSRGGEIIEVDAQKGTYKLAPRPER